MEVLVVDDEVISRRMIENTLQEGGYQVTTATNGCEALEILKQRPIQLVVVDWEMPVMDGIEFCQSVRSGDSSRYVYIVMLTSRSQPSDAISGLSVGADDFVTKPFDPVELIMRIHSGRRVVAMESRDLMIFALAKLAESRDPETGAHLDRVRNYCRILALHLQRQVRFQDEVDDEFIRLLYDTSPLHDIGKVSIPDHVLLKPARLTTDEFEIMKTHTIRGAETIESMMEQFPNAAFLKMARDITLSHHEKYDGRGYPHGVAGEQIPLCSRIVAVADVYDALTSKRIYKKAYSHSRAKSAIVAGSGKHFDPAIVDAFLDNEDSFIATRKRFQDNLTCTTHGMPVTNTPFELVPAMMGQEL
ncbi:HD domain-containing phosphohydrolase [Rhodopirellula sallentina]|uniref:Response regulator receiver modulated metal dependent phosphohydrolase n=1 Tax=Rhodopirellula sallentina SM41 TaxID=1263870 RepID=M5U7A1_9BACT|nr:HD domain-containing phosphohydrolase [Rhodopirellula sallentina]EMI57159.1 response regulator receiver modulated metal dependent phosphohydrolase [Rhodopirellula sallentina SM41]